MVSHLQSDDMMEKMTVGGRELIAATTAAEDVSAPAMNSDPFDQISKFDFGSMMYRLDSQGDKGCDWCLCLPAAKKETNADIEFYEGMVVTTLGTTRGKRIGGIAVGAVGSSAIVYYIMQALDYSASYGIVGCIVGGATGYMCLNKVDKTRAAKAIPKYKLIGVTIEDRSDSMPHCPCYKWCCAEDVSEITFKVKTSASSEGASVLDGCGVVIGRGLGHAETRLLLPFCHTLFLL
jgi:hypothetical protein